MIDVNQYNGIIRVHAGGIQIYVNDAMQEGIVSQLVKHFPENPTGRIEFDPHATWDDMGWEALTFMEDMNKDDFNRCMDQLRPLYIEGELVGYAIGNEHQTAYQAMFNAFTLKESNG